MSVKFSVPQQLINLWVSQYGKENTSGILNSLSIPPQLVVRVNTLKTSADALVAQFESEGVSAHKNETPENSVIIQKCGDITALESFKNGLFHVEDSAAQTAALLLDAQPGQRVLDVCAAPGGKTFTIAEQMQSGEIIACDIYQQRLRLVSQGAERLGIDFIQTKVLDASHFDTELGLFDRVLCDVPCSGLGIIRRKPEIRYKSADEIKAASALQYDILNNAYRYLKPGGKLVYATCTLNKAENESVVSRFLANNEGKLLFEKTFFPHTDGTDGFFAAVIEKNDR